MRDFLIYFSRKWLYTTNHKKIGLNYFAFSVVSGLSGAILAMLIRIELATPGSFLFSGDHNKYMLVVTTHAVIMVFFFVTPLLFGGFGNYLLPVDIGTRDVALPRINNFAFWFLPAGWFLTVKVGAYRTYSKYIEMNDASSYFKMQWTQRNEISSRSWLNYPYNSLITYESLFKKTYIPGNSFIFENKSTEINYLNFKNNFSNLKNNLKQKENIKWVLNENLTSKINYEGLDTTIPTKLTQIYDEKKYEKIEQPFDNINWWGNFKNMTVNYEIWDTYLNQVLHDWKTKEGTSQGYVDFITSYMIYKHRLPSNVSLGGWSYVVPLSCKLKYSALGAADLGGFAVVLAVLSSAFGTINLLITNRSIRGVGVRRRREQTPFFTLAILVAMRMLALVSPILLGAIFMLLSDRYYDTCFFDTAGGGDSVLFQHIFWFFGHPEVYILIFPCFGFVNNIIPRHQKKRLTAITHMVWATYTMGFMGFIVWGHHMYLTGLDHKTRTVYSTGTVMIGVPATTKICNWTISFLQGQLKYDITIFFTYSFFIFFVTGGCTGLFLSHLGLNFTYHDSYYVIGHFHTMLSGAVMCSVFAAYYYYFGTFYGVRYSAFWAQMHYIYYILGQYATIVPWYYLGYVGMPRRINEYPTAMGGWHALATVGHSITMCSIIFFIIMILESIFRNLPVRQVYGGVPRLSNRLISYSFKKITFSWFNYFQRTRVYLPVNLDKKINTFNCSYYNGLIN